MTNLKGFFFFKIKELITFLILLISFASSCRSDGADRRPPSIQSLMITVSLALEMLDVYQLLDTKSDL